MARRTRPIQQAPTDYLEEFQKLLESPEGAWRSARYLASTVLWPWAPAISTLIPRFMEAEEGNKKGLDTMAVDKYYRCYVNLGFVDYCMQLAKKVSETPNFPCPICGESEHHPLAYVAGVIVHESQHPARFHNSRAQAIDADPGQWNVAADLEINDDTIEVFKLEYENQDGKNKSTCRLCFPYFGKIQVINPETGNKIPSWEHIFSDMKLHFMGGIHMAPMFEGELPIDIPFYTDLDDVVTLQFDGYNLHVNENQVLKPGDMFEYSGYRLQFNTSNVPTPASFRVPEYIPYGVKIPDGCIAEDYYIRLMNLENRMHPMEFDYENLSKEEEDDTED